MYRLIGITFFKTCSNAIEMNIPKEFIFPNNFYWELSRLNKKFCLQDGGIIFKDLDSAKYFLEDNQEIIANVLGYRFTDMTLVVPREEKFFFEYLGFGKTYPPDVDLRRLIYDLPHKLQTELPSATKFTENGSIEKIPIVTELNDSEIKIIGTIGLEEIIGK